MRLLKRAAGILLLCLVPVFASAQTSVPINKPFQVAFDHDGANTTEYRVYLDGAKVLTIPVSALANGSVTSSPLTVTTSAAHQMAVSAFNAGVAGAGPAESTSGALVLNGCTNCGTPTAPKNLRIQIVATAVLNDKGQITGIKIASIEVTPPLKVAAR